ncbi:DUF5691 domain-containing protein [Thauera sinica]|uniref:DUF5691 domain-containing protein n=1 Tax=Thauera sinica TaxID=2665146 RepID=A0ABW1AWN6_9RHOO|nr:DUF5691 domain-containing protein [Thauera sp. K11]ATE61814.1 hypothetical protein CCZ27_19240 [Thauera sp. K11]
MSLLHELATGVLLGTERRPPRLPPLPGPLGDLLASASPPDTTPEVRVLRAAGVLATCGAAGYRPSETEAAAPFASPAETLRINDDAELGTALRQMLDDGPGPLRHEALRLLAASGTVLPPQLLPGALNLGQKSPSLRAALLPVLGERGRWLAGQQTAWLWASTGATGDADTLPDDSQWDHGSLELRKHYLQAFRSRDPQQALAHLQAGFSQLDARERAALLEQLANGLNASDGDFLEAQLADRSREVRQQAAGLLARLPASRYVARMGERMAACLTRERKLFRQALVLTPPAEFDPAWKSDGVEASRPKSESLGERAWWLYQLARALPLAWWPAHTGLTVTELIAWAKGSDWREAILRAWSEALPREGTGRNGDEVGADGAEWAAAFLACAPLPGLQLNDFTLLSCLPVAQREHHWLRMLETDRRQSMLGDILTHVAHSLPAAQPVISAEFAIEVLRRVREAVPTDIGKYDYTLRRSLPAFVCVIPPACLNDAISAWPTGQAGTEYFDDTLAAVLAIVEQRKLLHRTLGPNP